MNDEDRETREDADAVAAEVDDSATSVVTAAPEPADELAPSGGGASGNQGNGSGG